GVLAAKIPKFTIQPLVENAFIHAVEESVDPVTIDVRVNRQGEFLVITVNDDGPGLSPAGERRLRQSLGEKSNSRDTTVNGMGLANIHDRLQHLYGRQFGVSLQPRARGFSVQVTMPLVYDKTETPFDRPS